MKRIIASFTLIVGLFTATQVSAERDLETGVFLSRDPAGFVDGPNVYSYVKENPWSAFDPHGLDLQHLGQAWMGGDFSLQTFVGEGGHGPALLGMPAPHDVARQVQHAQTEGARISAISANAAREGAGSNLRRAAAYTAAGAGGVISSVTGIEAIHESIAGSRVEVNSSGRLENRQLGTVERVTKGLQGAVQVGAIVVSARASHAQAEAFVANEGPFIFRGGNFTQKNFTPRPVDAESGLSTFTTMERATPPGGKAQVIDASKLISLETVLDNTETGHVSIRPKDSSQMKSWIESRESETPHPLTKELQGARVREERRPKNGS